jgi:hypothetical protein
MEIWDYKDVKVKEDKEAKTWRLERNKGRQERNRTGPPTERKEVRFAKNRKSFHLTLDNGDKYEIEDCEGHLQITRADYDSALIVIAAGHQAIKIRKEKRIPFYRQPSEEEVTL